ncbi:hypothetical protein [Geotalea sp. SG265]|uniref:hypothetical protein n=1 Tax=Geotalea sp. SG265 TaxID=2922867 RepID=UPI001FAE9071|nr:hypothetical protein [Geotalea sp. SG265]
MYYLDGLWTPEPVADLPQLLQFARKNKVDLVVKEMVGDKHSDAEIMAPPPGLVFVGLYRSTTRNYQVAFYRLCD